MTYKIEICKDAKIASIATIVLMLIFRTFSPYLMILPPLGILTFLLLSYPGFEKVGTVGMARHIQTMYMVTLIAIIITIIGR